MNLRKTTILILLVASTALTYSCKKTEINNISPNGTDKPAPKPGQNVGSEQDVVPTAGETTKVSDAEILANNWLHVGEYAYYGSTSEVRVWKYKSGNMVVIINNVPDRLFWNTDFKLGTTLTGEELLDIKKQSKK